MAIARKKINAPRGGTLHRQRKVIHAEGSLSRRMAVAAGREAVPERRMRLLYFLADAFIAVFGISRPRPEQRKLVALGLGGGIVIFAAAFIAVLAWMLLGTGR